MAGGILAVMYGDKLISFPTVHTYSSLPHEMADILDMADMKVGTTSLNELNDFMTSPNPKIQRLADRLCEGLEPEERKQKSKFLTTTTLEIARVQHTVACM